MKLTRRNFLAWAGIAATGAIACDLFDDELRVQSPALIPEDLVKGRDNWYATYDPTVPGGQGVLVRVMEGRAKKVRGNPRFPTEFLRDDWMGNVYIDLYWAVRGVLG